MKRYQAEKGRLLERIAEFYEGRFQQRERPRLPPPELMNVPYQSRVTPDHVKQLHDEVDLSKYHTQATIDLANFSGSQLPSPSGLEKQTPLRPTKEPLSSVQEAPGPGAEGELLIPASIPDGIPPSDYEADYALDLYGEKQASWGVQVLTGSAGSSSAIPASSSLDLTQSLERYRKEKLGARASPASKVGSFSAKAQRQSALKRPSKTSRPLSESRMVRFTPPSNFGSSPQKTKITSEPPPPSLMKRPRGLLRDTEEEEAFLRQYREQDEQEKNKMRQRLALLQSREYPDLILTRSDTMQHLFKDEKEDVQDLFLR